MATNLPTLDITTTQPNRIPSLDGLRGIAIIMVLLGHGAYSFPTITAPLFKILGNGSLGVKIFFVLSGYLIHTLSLREIQKYGTFNWKHFYFRRILRIFPAFYTFLTAALLLTWSGLLTLTTPMLLSAATFTLNYRHLWDHTSTAATDYYVIGHYWTLALEEQFYLTWPLLILLLTRRHLTKTLWAIVLIAPLIRIAAYFLTPDSREQIGMMFHTSFDTIAAGVLLGQLLQNPKTSTRLKQLAANPTLITALILFLTLISPLLAEKFRGAYRITIGQTLELASLSLIITSAVHIPQTKLYRLLNWPPLTHIGILSYSLYLWNNLLLYSGGTSPLNLFPLNYLSLIAIALLSYHLIEKPFLKLKTLLHRPTPLTQEPTTISK